MKPQCRHKGKPIAIISATYHHSLLRTPRAMVHTCAVHKKCTDQHRQFDPKIQNCRDCPDMEAK